MATRTLAPGESLVCDCLNATFTVDCLPDDTLVLTCVDCSGRALTLGLWEEA